jgi:hypothetical protein
MTLTDLSRHFTMVLRFSLFLTAEDAEMGNRDKRGREKRKPKKTAIQPASASARPVPVYTPAAPAQQEQTDMAPVKIP